MARVYPHTAQVANHRRVHAPAEVRVSLRPETPMMLSHDNFIYASRVQTLLGRITQYNPTQYRSCIALNTKTVYAHFWYSNI